MPREKIEREELRDYITENQQKAIKPPHRAPEAESSLKRCNKRKHMEAPVCPEHTLHTNVSPR